MSIPRRLGRLARGFVSNLDDERLKETIRKSRERGETLKGAFGAAWRGAAKELRAAEERRAEERDEGRGRGAFFSEARASGSSEGRTRGGWRRASSSSLYVPKRYPPEVLVAYHKLGLGPGSPVDEVRKKRRELVKRHHPDRFVDPEQRKRAERLTAEINAAHDTVERYLLRS